MALTLRGAVEQTLYRIDALIDEGVENMHATLSYNIGMYEATVETLESWTADAKKWAMHMEALSRAHEAEADLGKSMQHAPEYLSHFAGRAYMFRAIAKAIEESWDGDEETENDYEPVD
jgi:hypothetical protein